MENAIEHGVKPCGHSGCVCVHVVRQVEVVEIRVQDDGVGFEPEAFGRIIDQDVVPENGYGLRNVAERLRLYYGNRCFFGLEKVETGTSILIRIVDQSQKEEENVQNSIGG